MVIDEKLKKDILSRPFFKGKVITGSMEPVIRVGDEIVVDVKASNLKRFDIIVFIKNEKLICHYLWTMNRLVKPLLLQTRSMYGQKDFPIEEESYIGKVISHRLSWWRRCKIIFRG